MTQTMGTSDQGGSHYIELIKSNLQFVYGREYTVDVISQLKAADQWQVHVVKITSDTWSVTFSESGPVLLNVLEKLHRKSGEMLNQAFSRNPVTAPMTGRRRKIEEAKAARAAKAAAEEAKKKKQGPEDDIVKPVAPSPEDAGMSLLGMIPQYDCMDMEGTRDQRRVPNRWATRSPPREMMEEGLDLRTLGCPNYGLESDFHRISPWDPDAFTKLALLYEEAWANNTIASEEEDRYGLVHSFPVRPAAAAPSAAPAAAAAPAPAPAAAPAPIAPKPEPVKTQAKAPARWRVSTLDKWPFYPESGSRVPLDEVPTLRGVILFIKWPGYGQTMVVDDCQLSIKAIQRQVKTVLRDHGTDLFIDAKAKAVASTVFTPTEVQNFTVTVKTLIMNEQTILLGPNFEDDLSKVAKGAKGCRSIKIETEVAWHGASLDNNAGPSTTV